MKFLIDTHVLLWWLTANPRLSPKAREIMDDGQFDRHVSAVTAFEIANKVRIGKLEFARQIIDEFDDVLAEGQFLKLDISISHSKRAGLMPGDHRDPFDRLLAAQAEIEGLVMLTNDPEFESYSVQSIW